MDNPFEACDVTCGGLDQGGAPGLSRVTDTFQQVDPGQGQECQQVAQHTLGIAASIDKKIQYTAAGCPITRARGGRQVCGTASGQMPWPHHPLPGRPDEPPLYGAPSRGLDCDHRVPADREKTDSRTQTRGHRSARKRLEAVVIRWHCA